MTTTTNAATDAPITAPMAMKNGTIGALVKLFRAAGGEPDGVREHSGDERLGLLLVPLQMQRSRKRSAKACTRQCQTGAPQAIRRRSPRSVSRLIRRAPARTSGTRGAILPSDLSRRRSMSW
jgi:hypothetical protein